MFNKSTECAMAAMSLLAEVWGSDAERLTARRIAEQRVLPGPFVAKVLTNLSQAGLVSGAPGPHGGYSLGRAPDTITLRNITECFERIGPMLTCPYEPSYCGETDTKCPLHDDLMALQEQKTAFLERTTLDVFCRSHPAGA